MTTLIGTVGDDTLTGGAENDTIEGGLGNDYIFGFGGNGVAEAGNDLTIVNYFDVQGDLGARAPIVLNNR